MKSSNPWTVSVSQILLVAAIAIALVAVRATKAGDEPVHLVTDWSNHHLIFSAPRNLAQHVQLLSDPRYVQQLVRRNVQQPQEFRNAWRWSRAPEGQDTLPRDWSMTTSTSATSGYNAISFPAKFSFNAGIANCVTPAPPAGQKPDFVAFNTSVYGTASQASVIAYTNLYATTCTGTVPSVYWAYNTGGVAWTAMVLSPDGSQVAFLQDIPTNYYANLTILKWAAGGTGTASSPTTLTAVSNATYRTCTAPCMTNIQLNSNTSDYYSSPFYDYTGSDTLYVGDTVGILHKFTGVFSGTPAEDASGHGWPVTINSSAALTSPVRFPGATAAASYVYVGDSTGYFYHVAQTSSTAVTTVKSGQLGTLGLDDGPLVDATTGKAYVFIGGNTAATTSKRIQVAQFSSGFAAGDTGDSIVTVSNDSTSLASNFNTSSHAFFAGTFDNTYYNSSGGTGHMYVCGTATGVTALWRITVTAGALTAATQGPAISTSNPSCSPITEFNNGAVDRIFVGVANSISTGSGVNCGVTTGCIMSFNITGGALPTTVSAHAAAASGTSPISVDGYSASTGASQVYFSPLANQTCTTSATSGSCAIQASQSGLN